MTADGGYDTTLSAADRKRTGAWYTPPELVRHVVAMTIPPTAVVPGGVVTVLDPACGDGRFLVEAAARIRSLGGTPRLTGADIDAGGLDRVIGDEQGDPIERIHADSLSHDWGGRAFDVVVGNPPFLSQMATATVRKGGSAFGGGPYADAAADFLALAAQLANPNGGRVGLVLPMSLLTARDAGPIRGAVAGSAALQSFWWSDDPVFDAMVRTCAISLERGVQRSVVERTHGLSCEPRPPVPAPDTAAANHHWAWLIADAFGLPVLPLLRTNGTMSERGLVTANFRDQYYGLVGAVVDSDDPAVGPPLITTGLIDVGRCDWGVRPTRFAKQTFTRPCVDRTGLVPFMQRWADRCLVPKVLVATQTRVLEAVADPDGGWLPAVPVIRVVPTEPSDVWTIAAVLTSPVASVLIAEQSVGSGLSAATVRVSQRTLGALAWPAGSLAAAAAALQAGDIAECGHLVDAAYGVEGVGDEALFEWWWHGVSSSQPAS
ncbi:MAG: N-6 DNA methylase [Ilumatobacteraceae bacterium]